MDRALFWSLMEQTKRVNTANRDEQTELLVQELVKLPAADIIAFDEIFSELNNDAYDWNLWAAAYIINCGCSDDGFMDFRAWLIGQGKITFEKALPDPQILADVVEHPFLTRPIHLFAVASQAYKLKTRQEIPHMLPRPHIRLIPTGDKWDESQTSLREKYPKLYEKFGDCKELFDEFDQA